MPGLFRRLRDHIRAGREARAARTIQGLKGRYHLFRGILEANNRAVTLLSQLDMELTSVAAVVAARPRIHRLLDTTSLLVDNLDQLEPGRHAALANRQHQAEQTVAGVLSRLPAPAAVPICLPLDRISPEMTPAVGAKAANLARARRDGHFPVPDGFVIPLSACRAFLEHNDLMLTIAGIAARKRHEPLSADITLEVREKIMAATIPGDLGKALADAARPFLERGQGLAIRSSAASEDNRLHSFAGQFATVLNVVDQAGVEQGFKQVIASAFNRRGMAYRLDAGLDPFLFDMAVCFLAMVPARSAGVLLTRSPLPGHDGMLATAVYGLGEAAVDGSTNTDILALDRQGGIDPDRSSIADKTTRLVTLTGGGIGTETVAEPRRRQPALAADEVVLLAGWGRELENLFGGPQDVEWAMTDQGPVLLQVRPATGKTGNSPGATAAGTAARNTGRVHIVRSRADLDSLPTGPVILVLRESLVDATAALDSVQGVVVERGNPADHLSLVAREQQIPLLYGVEGATTTLTPGSWITVDGAAGTITPATADEIAGAAVRQKKTPPPVHAALPPLCAELRQTILPLHLTDAYGPTFSIAECRSLHDIVRYVHEKAVLAMFHAGDEALEHGGMPVHMVASDVPFLVNIIDLGGGFMAGTPLRRRVPVEQIRSIPFLALWAGVTTPGVNWGPPPGGVNMGPVLSSWLTDHRSARPVGMPNYAIISRDYLNINARMDFHFTMIDTVCGADVRSNYARFRFKGGGTSRQQRLRRARCIALILEAHGFYTDVTGDLVNASIKEMDAEALGKCLTVLGRLLGFTRLLDAVMTGDDMIEHVSHAFLQGDYALSSLGEMGTEMGTDLFLRPPR